MTTPTITRAAGADEHGVYVTVLGELPRSKADPKLGIQLIAKRVYLDGDAESDEARIVAVEDTVRFTLKSRAALRARAEGGAA